MQRYSVHAVCLVTLLSAALTASAANMYYVRAGATGNGSGADWTNACPQLPSTLVRGATYYIAGGSYGAYVFDDPLSGTQLITLRKATAADHGIDTGWQASYSDGEALFSGAGTVWTFNTGYYDIDGVVGQGKSPGTYGIRTCSTASRAGTTTMVLFGAGNITNVALRHIDFDWNNGSTAGPSGVTRHLYTVGASDAIAIEHSYFHHSSGFVFYIGPYDPTPNGPLENNYTIRGNYFYMNGGGGSESAHWETMWLMNFDNSNICNNVIEDTIGAAGQTGWVMLAKANNVNIFGNLFLGTHPDCIVGGNGVIATWSADAYRNDSIRIYNNTFANLRGVFSNFGINFTHNSVADSNIIVKNNLYYNARFSWAGVTSQSHEAFGGGQSGAGTSQQPGITTGQFINYAANDFRLASATQPADSTIGAQFNVDMFGNLRGADGVWDRGAFEHASNSGATYYVRAGATGSRSGADWVNAYPALPATLQRGATYYLADGSYGSYSFNTAVSGSQLITIKKATAADHGTSAGWQSSYGDGCAAFSHWNISTSYWVFDGQIGGGPGAWESGHGIYVGQLEGDVIVVSGSAGHLAFRHMEVDGLSNTNAPRALFYMVPTGSDITMQHMYIHDIGSDIFQIRGNMARFTLEYSKLARNSSSATGAHGDGFEYDGGVASEWIHRYNWFDDVVGTYLWGSHDGGTFSNNAIYGNIISGGLFSNGLVGALTAGGTITGLKFYNNTIVNVAQNAGFIYLERGTNNQIFNNLYYNAAPRMQGTHDYNWFFNAGAQSEAHLQNGDGSPFVNLALDDYRLAAATNAGSSLPAAYASDMSGNTRGSDSAWDRGAYEFVASAPTTFCVRAGATGNGSGSDWSNAFPALPATLQRGATYYLAAGTYSGYTFDDPASGSQLITIKKAVEADHGTATGWSPAYGASAAQFNGSLNFTTGYWTLDGQSGGGPGSWTSGFGFRVNHTTSHAIVLPSTADNIALRHIELQGNLTDGVHGVHLTGADNVTISYWYTENIGNCPFFMVPVSNFVAEYGYVGKFSGSAASHSEIASIWGGVSGAVTFRYNVFANVTSTGGLMWDNNEDHSAQLRVYGNVFYRTPTSTWDNGANGLVGGWTGGSGEDCFNMRIFNNSFINVTGRVFTDFIMRSGDNQAYNNLFYNCSTPSYGDIQIHDYNHYINAGDAQTELNGSSAASGDPFVDFANLNFALKAATSRGMTLTAPYTSDPLGVLRGADGIWDRGAFEFAGVTPPTAPAITAQPQNKAVTIGQTAAFSVTASGTAPLSYQWQKNGSNISGGTSASYTTPATTSTDNGATFRCVVSNSAGSVTSNAATLTVTAAPQGQTLFTTQTPATTNNSDGSGVNYELGMRFTATVSGQITAIRFFKASNETGTHTGRIWNATGMQLASVVFASETSAGWQEQALATPLSISANSEYMVSVNTGATYYVDTVSGLATQIVNGNLKSVVGSNGRFGSPGQYPTQAWSDSNYFRDVRFVAGSNVAPSITTQPLSETVNVGQSVSFSVVATGTAPLTYQWKKNSSAISGATAASYIIASAQTSDVGSYSVTVTNVAGSVTSVSASLVVNVPNRPPMITSAASASPDSAYTGQSIAFSVGASDPDGDTLSYVWSFGDGASASIASASHAYAAAGTYTVTATVSDSRGGTASSSVSVAVTAAPLAIRINGGGAASGSFTADTGFSGGRKYATSATINVSAVSSPAPQAVYRSERYGNFTYTFAGLVPELSYTVRLHFAEIYWSAAGRRLFNVSINRQNVLSNFDIFAATGARYKAIVREFSVTPDASGQIVMAFTTLKDNAKISGIEIIPSSVATVDFSAAAVPEDAQRTDGVIDLGTVRLNRPFTLTLDAPTAAKANQLRWKAVKLSELPKGVAVKNGIIGGRPKAEGVFTFSVDIKGKSQSARNTYVLAVVE